MRVQYGYSHTQFKVICTLNGTEIDMETRGGVNGFWHEVKFLPYFRCHQPWHDGWQAGKIWLRVHGKSICFGSLGEQPAGRCRKTVRMVTSQVLVRRTKELYLYRVG